MILCTVRKFAPACVCVDRPRHDCCRRNQWRRHICNDCSERSCRNGRSGVAGSRCRDRLIIRIEPSNVNVVHGSGIVVRPRIGATGRCSSGCCTRRTDCEVVPPEGRTHFVHLAGSTAVLEILVARSHPRRRRPGRARGTRRETPKRVVGLEISGRPFQLELTVGLRRPVCRCHCCCLLRMHRAIQLHTCTLSKIADSDLNDSCLATSHAYGHEAARCRRLLLPALHHHHPPPSQTVPDRHGSNACGVAHAAHG